ncbi:WD40-repeat-containing domain protein [Dendryphion nanum]|uniref:WD40-repeat-containing domain protein n=1 Tax=Dendryphion nanum TaxID=256645 RepID=A0A9P9DGV0_9PLEO|nr:WD40-repeat-containing domain protein [Dendryphion nanum]
MAPKTKTKLKATRSQDFAPSKGKRNVLADLESGPSDDEMQLATIPKEPEWEGFEQEEDKSSEEEDDDDTDDEKMDIEEVQPVIDESEEELERLVFGDSEGFRKSVKGFSLDDPVGAESEEDLEADADLENVADQDLFFIDSGPGIAPPPLNAAEDAAEEAEKPAWEDSDDERLTVSLLDRRQNKKLRETEEDDVIGGKDYIRRLRKQYQSLYPTPDWAIHATNKSKRKRRTREAGDDESDSDSDVEMADEDDLSTQPLARLLKDADILDRNSREPAKRRKLQSGTINIRKLRGVAQNGPSSITSLSFHPTYPLLLSSGPSATLSLHHIKPDPPNPNPLLTSLHIKHTPLKTTAFHPSPSDSRIFLSARRRYFHVWDLATGSVEKVTRVYGHQHEQRTMENFSLSPDGRHMALLGSTAKGGGVINILDATTLQWITQARIDSRGGIADFVWWGDGNGICIVGKNGEVTEWSFNEGVVGRWTDDGALGTTVIAVGGKSGRNWLGGDRWVAIGSTSGIVNIYDRRAWQDSNGTSTNSDHNGGIPKAPTPIRVLDNLTTPISFLKFSPDGQVMAMASRWKSNALRLVHLPSATVYKNWPTQVTHIGRISAIAWGNPTEADEREGCLALLSVANEMGKIRLWEVRA